MVPKCIVVVVVAIPPEDGVWAEEWEVHAAAAG
jgi:hypothetical protein